MYCSLESADIELKPRDGRRRFIQIDARAPEEMSSRPALSSIMALMRCLNPRKAQPEIDLYYNCLYLPPQFMIDVIKAAGGHLWVGEDPAFVVNPLAPAVPTQPAVDQLLNAAFAELAGEVMRKNSAGDALRSLERLGREAAARFPDENDEVSFWTMILELAALCGEAIRAQRGEAWAYDVKTSGTFPLAYQGTYQGEPANINPLGKALKFVRGQGAEPSALVKFLAGS